MMLKSPEAPSAVPADKGANAAPPSSAAKGCVHRNLFQRILGIPSTEPPADAHAWSFAGGTIAVDMDLVPELRRKAGAVRLEGGLLPAPVLLLHGVDGHYHAFVNRCGHGGRKLDPCASHPVVQCCSMGKSAFDYAGNIVEGPATTPIRPYPVRVEGDTLYIDVE